MHQSKMLLNMSIRTQLQRHVTCQNNIIDLKSTSPPFQLPILHHQYFQPIKLPLRLQLPILQLRIPRWQSKIALPGSLRVASVSLTASCLQRPARNSTTTSAPSQASSPFSPCVSFHLLPPLPSSHMYSSRYKANSIPGLPPNPTPPFYHTYPSLPLLHHRHPSSFPHRRNPLLALLDWSCAPGTCANALHHRQLGHRGLDLGGREFLGSAMGLQCGSRWCEG